MMDDPVIPSVARDLGVREAHECLLSSPHHPPRSLATLGMTRFVALVVVIAVTLAPAHSQTSRNPDLDRIRSDIARLRERLEIVRSQAQSAQQQLEAADLELGIRSRELDLATDLQNRVDLEHHATEAQIAALTPRIEREKKFLAKRLAALYRLGNLSYLRILLSLDDEHNPVQAMSMLSYLVSSDARAVSRFQTSQQQLRGHLAELADQRKRVDDTRRVVEQRKQAVASAREHEASLLASLRAEGTQSEHKIAALEEKAKRLERLVDILSRQRSGVVAAADIRAVQGALGWPVHGRIFEHFGKQRNAKFATVTMNNGLKIAARPGVEVRAIYPGTVLFSQWSKGYGNLVILDHGNRVFSLYGNLKSPLVAAGDRVNGGQMIAGVGESDEAQAGYLYFEIRQDNRPEDPQKWLR